MKVLWGGESSCENDQKQTERNAVNEKRTPVIEGIRWRIVGRAPRHPEELRNIIMVVV